MTITRMKFGDLPIGARFGSAGWGGTVVYVKTGKRKYRTFGEHDDFPYYQKSPGVMVDCIEDPLRLAVLIARDKTRNAD